MLSRVGFHPLALPLSLPSSLAISSNTSSSLCSPFSFKRSTSHSSSFFVSKILTLQLPSFSEIPSPSCFPGSMSSSSSSSSSSSWLGADLSMQLPMTLRHQESQLRNLLPWLLETTRGSLNVTN
ncbi:unnamed protein product [Musa acuminata subsp. burmannicoides]